MSSRSYIPPPVKQVEIPKARAAFRKLGIPTVSDRVGQTVAKLLIEPILTRYSTQIPMDIDRDDRRNRRLPSPDNGVGNTTGWLS